MDINLLISGLQEFNKIIYFMTNRPLPMGTIKKSNQSIVIENLPIKSIKKILLGTHTNEGTVFYKNGTHHPLHLDDFFVIKSAYQL